MRDEQSDSGIPTAARRLLVREAARGNQPARSMLGRADRDIKDNDHDDEDNHAAGEQHEAGGEPEVEAPGVDGRPVVVVEADPEAPAPSGPHFAPRPRAKGGKHPPVPTRAQIERHALEHALGQHVNYEPWCSHCLQASALMKQHPLVAGESPSMPTVSADFCFMKGRDADSRMGFQCL